MTNVTRVLIEKGKIMKDRPQVRFRPNIEMHQSLLERARAFQLSEGLFAKLLVSLCFNNLDLRYFDIVREMCLSREDLEYENFGSYCQQIAAMLEGVHYENGQLDENKRIAYILKFANQFIQESGSNRIGKFMFLDYSEDARCFKRFVKTMIPWK